VARQLGKHVVGLCWNETSRRYIESAPCFFAPAEWRGRAIDVKQGSGGAIESQWLANEVYHEAMRVMDDAYLQLLDIGVCPEQARMILPQSMLTTWMWTGSLYAFARVCKLRMDSHAQVETRDVAEGIAAECGRRFPVSWRALTRLIANGENGVSSKLSLDEAKP
jgi:thymidylate synthase (FAD)